jgi:hypothetical protein
MKKIFFVKMVSKKPGFSETSRPTTVLIFIAHLERTLMDLYMKLKKNRKKIFFCLGKGGCPLKGTPPLSGVSQERSSENS